MMRGWNMTGWGWGWMIFMTIIGALLIAAIVIVIFRSTAANQERPRADDAIDILDRRLARGEIDEAEYRQIREALKQPRS